MAFSLALAGTLVAQAYVLWRLRFDIATIALVLSSTLLQVGYLGYTSVDERNYDGSSHVQYILSIARGDRLPRADECGPCGHPPLYYALAAGWTKLGGDAGTLELRLQWLSLMLFFGFVVTALLILRSGGLRPATFRLGAALLLFWPSGIINAVRVHNDALASLAMVGAMFFTARWDARSRPSHFYAALAACACAQLTKATGHTVAAALVLLTAIRVRPQDPRTFKPLVAAVLVLATAAALPAALRESRRPRTVCERILGSACDGRYVPAVVDRASRFVYFDPVDFVRRTDALTTDPQHDYFLNRLAKSSLFGVMPLGEEFSGKRRQALGTIMSAVLLAMAATAAISALAMARASLQQLRRHRVYALTCALMLVFLLAFRLRAPNEFHEDFRHIFPALAPFCLGYAALVQRAGRRFKLLYFAGFGLGLAMVVSSAAFFIPVP
ncbi:MAG: uncharacterized protein K0R38_7508 [Polyangiaceae bacterium]|jgi:4-amino-4-deoxy-L-arabinose transferase-like glycosyltransferase|nr:uncharacterized protein [Polyangiaceae bacterium]